MGEELAGLTPGSFHWSSRKQKIHLVRVGTSNLIMRELGMDYNELSKYIDTRNRATFYYWYKKHEDFISGWDEYRLFYSNIKSKWLNTDYEEEEYMDSQKFEMILYRNGIPKSEPNISNNIQKVRFKVRLGNFNANIYRTSESAPKCIKNILTAFSRYKKIKIEITKIQKYERIYKITPKNSRD